MNFGLLESWECAESGRQILVKIGAVDVEIFAFKDRHGKSDFVVSSESIFLI